MRSLLLILALLAAPAISLVLLTLLTAPVVLLLVLAHRSLRRLRRRRATAGVFVGFGPEVQAMLAGSPVPANRVVTPSAVWDVEVIIKAAPVGSRVGPQLVRSGPTRPAPVAALA